MRKILFVDSKYDAIGGVQWLTRSIGAQWAMTFVRTEEEALKKLAENDDFDAVVINPQSNAEKGMGLLAELMRHHPRPVRMVLSDKLDQEMLTKWLGPAHRRLSRSCTAADLEKAIERACALRDLLANESLQRVVAQMDSLPSLPSVYAQLIEELQSPSPSVRKVGEIIAHDLALTAKVLQVVNSAFFGLRRKITSPSEATMFLGLDTIISLVLAISVFSHFNAKRLSNFSPEALWSHSLQTAVFAKQIVRLERHADKMAEDAFTAGLLHDAGKIVLATMLPEWYEQALRLVADKRCLFTDAEQEVFGTTHAEVGAYLFGLWGLPDQIIEAVAFHHRPGDRAGGDLDALIAVHAADIFEHEGRCYTPVPDFGYLERNDLLERFMSWRNVCLRMRGAEERS